MDPQIVFVAVPATVWLVTRAPRMLRRAPVVAVAAVVGASPWLIWNLQHHWMSLDTEIFAGLGDNGYVDHLRGFFNPLLPMALGLQVPYSRVWILERPLALGIYVALLAAFAFAVVRRWRRAELLLVVALAYPFLYSLSPAAFYLFEPRYLFLLSPVVALLVALALGGPGRQVLGLAAVAVLCVAGLRQINVPNPVTAPASLDPLFAALDEHRVDRLFTPYVIAQSCSTATSGSWPLPSNTSATPAGVDGAGPPDSRLPVRPGLPAPGPVRSWARPARGGGREDGRRDLRPLSAVGPGSPRGLVA